MTLTYGELPDFGTFQRLFAAHVSDGLYTVRAGLSGLFEGTQYALAFGDSASYNCLALYELLETCIRTGSEQEDAQALLGTEAPCLQDAADVMTTLGVEWV